MHLCRFIFNSRLGILGLVACLLVSVRLLGGNALVDFLVQEGTIAQPAWITLLLWQFVHINWLHLGVNLVGLGLLVALYPTEGRLWKVLVAMLICGWIGNLLFVLIGRASGDTPLVVLGLSGALHALGWLVAVANWQQLKSKLLIGLLIAKIGFEQWGALSPFSPFLGFIVVYDAHLYAVVAAMWMATVLKVWTAAKRTS